MCDATATPHPGYADLTALMMNAPSAATGQLGEWILRTVLIGCGVVA